MIRIPYSFGNTMQEGKGFPVADRGGLSSCFFSRLSRLSCGAGGLLALVVLFLLCGSPAQGAARYERLKPGDSFAVQHVQGNLRYEARLRLFARHFFELSEAFTWKKQPPLRRTFSGLWFQLQGGSLLWLHNRYGLSRPLNVGGARALYADMHLPRGRGALSVVFRPEDTPEDGPLHLMGVMLHGQEGMQFEESASGLVFPLAEPLPAALREARQPLFLELEARLAGDRLAVGKVEAADPRLPAAPEATPRALTDILPGRPWLLELPDGEQFTVSFAPGAAAASADEAAVPAGLLDLAGPGVYLSLPLYVEGHAVRLSPGQEERDMLQALGLETLRRTLDAVCRWELHGPLLVLYAGTEPCCTLLQQGQSL